MGPDLDGLALKPFENECDLQASDEPIENARSTNSFLWLKALAEFRFVTDGIHSALKRAKDAASGKDVRLGGGVSTIRQYLGAALRFV
jgi:hypothetical protein